MNVLFLLLLLFPLLLFFSLIHENRPLLLVLNTETQICENCGDLLHFGRFFAPPDTALGAYGNFPKHTTVEISSKTHLLQTGLLNSLQQLSTYRRLHPLTLSIRISHTTQPQMTPPCRSFPASELPLRIQQDASGRRRKVDGAGSVSRKIDLSACELFQMLQYKCEVQRPLSRESPVRCFAVDRLFRR